MSTANLVIKYLNPHDGSVSFVYGNADHPDINTLAALIVPAGVSYTVITKEEAEYPTTLEAAKLKAYGNVKKVFIDNNAADVVYNTFSYQGGYDSAMKLDAAKRLAELAGLTSVEIFDSTNIGHILSTAQLTELILSISFKYQTELKIKNDKLVAINNATTIQEALAI